MNVSDNETEHYEINNTFEEITKGLYLYGIPMICIFGTFGNILSFLIFVCTKISKQSSSIYIAALSVSDTTFLWLLLLSWLGNGRIGIYFGHSRIWCHLMIFLTYVCSFLSVWYVVLIMIDRYVVVCHPLHVPLLCSKTRARRATGAVTGIAILMYFHSFFTTEVTGPNCAIQPKPFLMRLLSIMTYTDTAITFVIPFVVIFFLNIIVLVSIRRSRTAQTLLKGKTSPATPATTINVLSKAQYRITRTFVLVSVTLLLTNVPSHGIRFYIILKGLIGEEDSLLVQGQHICLILYYMNFAVNFLLYSISSRIFRKYISFKHLCRCFRKRRYRPERLRSVNRLGRHIEG